jgi:hypothetical protein
MVKNRFYISRRSSVSQQTMKKVVAEVWKEAVGQMRGNQCQYIIKDKKGKKFKYVCCTGNTYWSVGMNKRKYAQLQSNCGGVVREIGLNKFRLMSEGKVMDGSSGVAAHRCLHTKCVRKDHIVKATQSDNRRNVPEL